jgi:hypothetical protein
VRCADLRAALRSVAKARDIVIRTSIGLPPVEGRYARKRHRGFVLHELIWEFLLTFAGAQGDAVESVGRAGAHI